MTGSGKTGLVTVMIEEAARAQVPTMVIDVKRDLLHLPLAFPSSDPGLLEPWVELEREGMTSDDIRARAVELSNTQLRCPVTVVTFARLRTRLPMAFRNGCHAGV